MKEERELSGKAQVKVHAHKAKLVCVCVVYDIYLLFFRLITF